jgi:hypothetical protein
MVLEGSTFALVDCGALKMYDEKYTFAVLFASSARLTILSSSCGHLYQFSSHPDAPFDTAKQK